MRLALLPLVAAALLLPLAALAAPAPKPLSKNLLKNPGAELGPVTPDGATEPLPVPAWETTGGFHVVGYGGYRWAPAPADKTKGSGSKFFSGCLAPAGQTVNVGTATQTASLARWGAAIDKGGVGADALRRARRLQRHRQPRDRGGRVPERCGAPGRAGRSGSSGRRTCSARASHASSRGRRPAWCRRVRAR